MPSQQDYLQLQNRIKQGGAVAVATFAMTAVTSFRMGHERDLYLGVGSVAKFSSIMAGIAGLIWSLMPKAKESPADTIEEAKEQLYPAMKVVISRIMANEESFKERVRDSREQRGYDYSCSTDRSRDSREESMYGYRGSAGYDRLNRRYGYRFSSNTGFDDDFDRDSPPDDDYVSDEEFAEILDRELLEDPFYQGPGSVFDRM